MVVVFRKLYRMIGLLFPILYIFYSKSFVLNILIPLTLIFIFIDVMRLEFPKITKVYFKYFSKISKGREKHNPLGTTYVLLGEMITILFFSKEIAIVAIFFLIFGDTAASFGKKYGKIKTGVWDKTLEGSIACFIVCVVVGWVLTLWIGLDLRVILLGAVAVTVIEAVPLFIKSEKRYFYLDDNLTMAVFSAWVMSFL